MIPVLGLFAVGLGLARWGSVPDGTPGVLSWMVVNVSLPALVVSRVSGMALGVDALVPLAVAWGVVIGAALCTLAVCRVAGFDDRVTGMLLLVVPLANTSFLGIPAVEALLGADHVPYAVVFDQPGTFLALATYGTFVTAAWGRSGELGGAVVPVWRRTLTRVVTFPPFIALVVGLGARVVHLPGSVHDTLELLGATLVPLAMVQLGLTVRLPRQRRVIVPTVVGLALRMVVVPAMVFGVAAIVHGTGPAWETARLEAAMPPMVTAALVGADAGFDAELGSAMVGCGLLLAMVALPAWAALL